MTSLIPVIEGTVEDGRCDAGEIPFTNLNHLTDGTLVPGNPDMYSGARPEQLDKRIRRELGGQIVPSTQHDLPLAPNYFVEVKGPDGSLAVATRQACYDGALGARGIRSLQTYEHAGVEHDNKAHTLTSIYHGGQLRMFTSHPIPATGNNGSAGYAMTRIGAWSLIGGEDDFRRGAAAYRNGRDWAKEQRDQAIKDANERAAHEPPVPALQREPGRISLASDGSTSGTSHDTSHETITKVGLNVPPYYESDTSAEELFLESPPAKRAKPDSTLRPSGSQEAA